MLRLVPVQEASAVTMEYRGQRTEHWLWSITGDGSYRQLQSSLWGRGSAVLLVAVAAATGSRALWRAKKGSTAAGNCDGQR